MMVLSKNGDTWKVCYGGSLAIKIVVVPNRNLKEGVFPFSYIPNHNGTKDFMKSH
jgi:hypothetical protein